MNRFFEFSRTQMRALTVLVVLIIILSGYRIIRRYYVLPARQPRPWTVKTLERYKSILTVDINLSPADSLELIPGIGPVLAQRIVNYRLAKGCFTAIDSLVNVPGIGPAKLNKIRKFVTISK